MNDIERQKLIENMNERENARCSQHFLQWIILHLLLLILLFLFFSQGT